MSALPVAPMPPAEPTGLSQGERILDTFIAPSKTFTDLRRSASWWAPFLLFAVAFVAFVYSVDTKVGFSQVVQYQIDHSPKASRQMEELPPDLRAQQIHTRALWSRRITYVVPVFTLLIYAIFAGLYFASFKFGANADLTFGRAYAVVVYASLPEVLRQILAVITLFAGAAPDSFNLQNPVATNLGTFRSHHFAFPLWGRLIDRHLPAVDGRAHRYRILLRRQSETEHRLHHRDRVVCPDCAGILWPGRAGVVR